MKLSQVVIENHSRLQDLSIEVRDNLVLVGPNDSGKSSLLRCLDLILGSSTAQLYNKIAVSDFRAPALPLKIEVVLIEFDSDDEALFPDEIDVAEDGSKSLTIRLLIETDEAGTVLIRRFAPNGATGRQISREQLLGLGWKFVGAVDTNSRDFRRDRNSTLSDILSSIDLGDEAEPLQQITTQFQKKISDSLTLGDLRQRLAKQLSRAVPEKIEKDDLAFVSEASTAEDLLADIRLQIKKHDQFRSMDEQSDGARALFAIAMYDLVAESANFVAIDEPEVHLHPASQRSMARLLREGPNQSIVSTHSSHIVGLFSPAEVVSVRPGGTVVQANRDSFPLPLKTHAHWWVSDKLEPLTARRIFLVEGISDRIFVERVSELCGLSVDRLGVSILELDGAGFVGQVRSVFGDAGFNIPLSFLIDEDAEVETARMLGIEPTDFPANSVYVCSRDLEEQYVKAIGATALWSEIESSQLFNRNELANCEASGESGIRTEADVAAFCRRQKSKVRAALIASSLMSADSAEKIEPMYKMLTEAATS